MGYYEYDPDDENGFEGDMEDDCPYVFDEDTKDDLDDFIEHMSEM